MVVDGANVSVGSPTVAGAKVEATVLSHGRVKKFKIFKLRRRKHYKRQQGHRQSFTEVVIGDITS
jgi:large subunit ribosomal protein L21